MLVFVDTGLLLSCFDDEDAARRDRARDWVGQCWQRRCGRLSTQVLNEFYSSARRHFPQAITAGDARAEVRRYQHWKPWSIDHPTVETAWAVESRYGVNYWDALIVAAAQQQGCELLLSETLPHEQRYESVQVINPFTIGPERLDQSPA